MAAVERYKQLIKTCVELILVLHFAFIIFSLLCFASTVAQFVEKSFFFVQTRTNEDSCISSRRCVY